MIETSAIAVITYAVLGIALSPPSSTVILANTDKPSSIIIETKNQKITIDKPNEYVNIDKDRVTEVKRISYDEIYTKFKDVIEHTPRKPTSILLYFEKRGKDLTPESKDKISEVLREINKRKSANVTIIGHTDTVGSNEMNGKLSLKRALYIKNLLEKHKMKLDTLEVKSYGENDLLVETADEVSEAKNRRVEVFIK